MDAEGCKFCTYLCLDTFAIFGSSSLPRSNQMWGFFVKHLVFSLNMTVVSMRSWLLQMSAPSKDLVFALLMLDKSIVESGWSLSHCEPTHYGHARLLFYTTCGGAVCWQGWVGDFVNSRVSSLCRLSFQSQIFLLSPPSVGMCQGLLGHSNHLELQAYPPWECLRWCYRIKLLVELFDLLIFVVWIDLTDHDGVLSHCVS